MAWVRYLLYTSVCTVGYFIANMLKIRDGTINWDDEIAASDAMYASPYSNSKVRFVELTDMSDDVQ